jgi:hypothetical protein
MSHPTSVLLLLAIAGGIVKVEIDKTDSHIHATTTTRTG